MKIIDRYLTFAFIKIFLICFISLTGLYIVIHLFTNLDEIVEIADATGSMKDTLLNFYGPRALEFFDRMAGILILIAGIFAIAMMQRRQELTAVQAAGVGKFRMVRPIIIASLVVVSLSVLNREILLPKFKVQLTRTAQNWDENESLGMNITKDHDTGILFRGEKLEPSQERILEPVVQLPIYLSDTISRMNARYGYLLPADKNHPAGIKLQRVTKPENMMDVPSMKIGEQVVVYSPRDYHWLKAGQCFVVTKINLQQLAFGQEDSGYESLSEMITSTKQPSQWYSRGKRIAVHSRIIRPVLDMVLLLLGLPLVIAQTNKNLLAAACISVGVILLVQVTTLGSQSLGSLSLIKSAALSAWLPAIIFIPLASLSMRTLRR
ncbi:LptF/LptG family permease [bacterium]|nr:LptF/LptG family permease [bacterium]